MGSELSQLEEIVGDPEALSLYKSFVDPQSNRQFPFMFTGPASPLSFTGMPLFVQMFTKFEEFAGANPFVGGSEGMENDSAPIPFTTTKGFESVEVFEKTRSADFD